MMEEGSGTVLVEAGVKLYVTSPLEVAEVLSVMVEGVGPELLPVELPKRVNT
jgi:hypothetical protein